MARSLNPRVWIRDWLNKPTKAEAATADAAAAALADSEARARYSVEIDPVTGLIVGAGKDGSLVVLGGRFSIQSAEAKQAGLNAEWLDRNAGSTGP